MCLAVPGQIIARDGDEATVDFQGTRVNVSVVLTPDVAVGGWVLVHAGLALQELDPAEARTTWEYLRAAEVVSEIAPALRPEGSAAPDGSVET